MAAPGLGLDDTMELLSRVLGAGDEGSDLTALSAALKTKLGLSNLKKPAPTRSPGVELLTRDVKTCRGIRSSPMDTCPSPFHPPVRTVPVCSIDDTTEAEMKGYGLAAMAPLATVYRSPPSHGAGDPGVPGRGTKAIATANLQIELPEFDTKNLPEWGEEFSEFWLLTGQQHADVRTKCTFIKKSCKKKCLQRQVKTVIRNSSNRGDLLKRLGQMHPVYGTDLSVGTEIEGPGPHTPNHHSARSPRPKPEGPARDNPIAGPRTGTTRSALSALASAGASGRHNEPGSRPTSTCPAQPSSKAGGDSPRGGGRHHGDRKADRSTESDRTGRGAAHQRGATRHAREARRRQQPRHEDRCQATTATGCREPGKRAQHTKNRATGQGAQDSRAPTPAHRTHGQWEAGPGRTPERTGCGEWESARPRTPYSQARGAPPRAPSCRPHSTQERTLWGRRRVPRPAPPHPQPVGSGPRPHARTDERLGVGERLSPDAPHPGKRRPPRAPSCRPHSTQERALWGW